MGWPNSPNDDHRAVRQTATFASEDLCVHLELETFSTFKKTIQHEVILFPLFVFLIPLIRHQIFSSSSPDCVCHFFFPDLILNLFDHKNDNFLISSLHLFFFFKYNWMKNVKCRVWHINSRVANEGRIS